MTQQQQYLSAEVRPSHAYEHGYDSAHDFAASSTAGSGGGGGSARGSGSGSNPSSQSRTYSNHSPHSTLRDLTPAPPPRTTPRAVGRSKGTSLQSPSSRSSPPPATRQPQDSGLRFEPGVTPSDVAPVLPALPLPGVAGAGIRSTGSASEVARADIPPAYTPD